MTYQSKAYALVNREDKRHYKEIQEYLSLKKGERILEIGCGRGFVVKKLQEQGLDAFGTDINENSIVQGVAKNLTPMNAEHLEFPDESFDKVYSFHTIEHIPSPEKMIQEIGRVLKSKGTALLVYPVEPIRGLFSIPASIIIYKHPLNARKIHLHKITPKKIEQWIASTNLQHVRSKFSFLSSPQYFTVLEKQ